MRGNKLENYKGLNLGSKKRGKFTIKTDKKSANAWISKKY